MTPPAGLDEHLPQPVRRRRHVSAALLVLAAGLALWAALTGLGPARVDAALLGEAVEERTAAWNGVAITITTIGNTFAMAVLATLVGAWSWARGRVVDAVFVVGAMAGAVLVFRGLKILIDRPRPPAAAQVITETNESLPSGHATMSMVVIGSLVVLGWAGRAVVGRVLMLTAAAIWVAAVGSTRVYLGVHWFSDVVAGWLVGAAWLALCAVVWSSVRSRPVPGDHQPLRERPGPSDRAGVTQ